jgi:hypothetical protein
VTVQDLGVILKKIDGLEEVDLTDPKMVGQKRNPYRLMQIADRKSEEKGKTEADELFRENPLVDESEIKQICTFNPHNDVIKSIQFIYSTDRPLIMTASIDRFVHIHSIDLNNSEDVTKRVMGLDVQKEGTLLQGYMMQQNYLWNFDLTKHGKSAG